MSGAVGRRPTFDNATVSSYGTAFVLDTRLGVEVQITDVVRAAVADGFRTATGGEMSRAVVLLSQVGLVDDVLVVLRRAGNGRLAVAEDNDDYGALWLVAAAEAGVVRTVHRRYVLNADPSDPAALDAALDEFDVDPRQADIVGPDAAAAAAAVFAVPAAGVVEAEQQSVYAWQQIGVVGGPFPWWDRMQLLWPVPALGEPLGWEIAPTSD